MSGLARSYKVLLLFFITAVFCSQPGFSQDLYWVNGQGNWNDPEHWSTQSGGTGGAAVPTSDNNVIIDGNSFTGSEEYIIIKGEATCHDFIWKEKSGNNGLKSRSFLFKNWTNTTLEVHGSVEIPSNIKNRFYGDFVLKSGHQKNTIDINSPLNADLIIDGKEGEWVLENELQTEGNIYFKQGSFTTNDHNISCNVFDGSGNKPREINFENSKVVVNQWNITNNKNSDIQSENLRLFFREGFQDGNFASAKDINYKQISSSAKASFTLSTSTDSATCWTTEDGSFSVTVSGGTMPFDYELYDDIFGGNLVDDVQNKNSRTHTFNNIYAGKYMVVVTDGDDDDQAQTNNVPPDTLQIDTVECTKALTCFDGNDAWLEAFVSGGTPPFTFTWELDKDLDNNFEDTLSSDSSVVTNMSQGVFRLTVEDANGCPTRSVTKPFLSFAGDYQDSIPDQLVIDNIETTPSCVGEDNGTITAYASGGTGEIDFFIVYTPTTDTTYDADGTFNNLAPGNYTVVAYDANNCETSQGISVGTYPKPTADAGSDEVTCEDVNFDLSNSASVPDTTDASSVTWNDDGAAGDFIDPNVLVPEYDPAPGQIGDVNLVMVVQGNGPCGSITETDTMVLTINEAPSADAGSDEEICEGSAFDFGTSTVEPTASEYSSLSWDDNGAGGNFNDNSILKPQYTPPAGFSGTITLTLTANGTGTCSAVSDDMELTVTAAPQADAGSDEEICEGDIFDFLNSGTEPSASDYNTLLWDDGGIGGSFSDNTALKPTYTPPAGFTGTVTLTLTATGNGSCAQVSDDMQLTVTAAPTADAGSDEEICEGTIFDFKNSTVEPFASDYSSLSWSDGGVGGSFSDPTALKPTYTPPADFSGTIFLTLTADGNGSCAPVSDDMELTVTAAPTADAGSDEEICESTAFDFNSSTVEPTASDYNTLSWDDGGIGGIFSDNTALKPTYTPPAGYTGLITLTLTATGNGSCAQTTDDMELTVVASPTVDAGSDEEICEGDVFDFNSSTVEPTASDYSSLSWDDGGVGGSFSDPSALKPTYTPPAGYTGTVTLTLTADGNANCAAASDDMELTITPAPTADAGSDEEICEDNTFDFNSSSVQPTASDYNTLSWDDGGVGGTFDDNSILKPQYTPPVGYTGTVTLTLTATGNGSCSSVSDNMELTVTPEPSVDAGSDEEVCEDNTFDFNSSTVEPTASEYSSLSWDDGGVGGTFSDNSVLKPQYTPPAGYSGTITLTLTANGNGSCSPVSDNMDLTVTPAPTADAGSDEEICEGDAFDFNTSTVQPSASNYSSLSWDDGGIGGSFDNSTILKPQYTPPAGYTGTVILTLTVNGNGSCSSVSDDMELTVTPAPSVDAGSDEAICEDNTFDFNSSSIQPTASEYSSLSWDDGGVGGSFSDNSVLKPQYTPPLDYTGTITLTLTANGNGPCSSVSDDMELTVTPEPTVDAGSDEEICEGNNFDFNTSAVEPTASEYSSLSWDDGGVGGSFSDNTVLKPVYTPPAGYSGTITLTLTANGNGNCAPASDDMELTVTAAPAVDAGSDEEICEGSIFDFNNSTTEPSASDYNTLTWDDGGAGGSFSDPSVLKPQYTPPVGYSGTITLTLTATGNGSCAQVADNMDLTVTAAPTADAGSDEEVCENTVFDFGSSAVQPSASNYNSLSWDDGGVGGSFNDNTILLPEYTPPVDFSGTITLTLTATGNGSCTPATDAMELTVTAAPFADAGPDSVSICYGDSVYLDQADTSNASSITWTTGGDGSFDNASIIDPSYEPGPNDLATGEVYLYLEADGNGSCNTAVDSIKIIIPPELIATIGSPRPYLIDETTTDVIVSIKVENHEYIEDLSYYLVSPNGNKMRLASYNTCFTFQQGTDLTFSTLAADTFDVCSDPLTGTYKLSGDLSVIDGEDPSNGAWRIRVEDHTPWTTNTFEGIIAEASIQFIDNHDVTGDPVTVLYEDDDVNKPIRENTGIAGDPPTYTEYTIPYGLETNCYGTCDATAVVFKSGGTPPYSSVVWTDTTGAVISTEDTVNLCAGKYYVEVTDALGCKTVDSVIVTEPPEIVFDSLNVNTIDDLGGCYGDSIGEAEAGAHGGTGVLEYSLIDTVAMPYDTLETNLTGNFYNLPAGGYVIEVIDERGCIKDTSFTITQPDSIEITYESFTSLSAPGASDGTVDVYAEGGTPPLTYELYDSIPEPDVLEATITTADTANFTNLPEGDYYAVVTDVNGCGPDTSSIFHVAPMEIVFTVDSVLCSGDSTGMIAAEVVGGIPPYTYQWTSLPTNDTLREVEGTPLTTDTLRNVWAGEFVLNVIEGTGINVRDTVTVYEPMPLTIDAILPDSTVSCFNTVDTFVVNTVGGTPPYNVTWYEKSTMNVVSSEDTAIIGAGEYVINVFDGNNCFYEDEVTLTEPDPISIDSLMPYSTDSLQVWASGGNGLLDMTLHYLDSDGNTDTIYYPDETYMNANQATFAQFDTLQSGTYKIIANDSLGCEPDTLTVSIPLDLHISIVEEISCPGYADGSIMVEVERGFAPYTYEWFYEGNPYVTHNSYNKQDTIYNLAAGNYSVRVTDSLGISATISIELPEGDEIVFNPVVIDSARCNQYLISDIGEGQNVKDIGRIKLDPYGGKPYVDNSVTPPDSFYFYTWSQYGEGISVDSVPKHDSLVDLTAGEYMITIYDSQGCRNDTSISIYGDSDYDIDVVIDQPASNPICLGDSVYLEADYISSNADSAMWDPLDDGLYPVDELETIGLQPEYSEEYLLIATKGYCANIDTLDLQIHPPLRFSIDENDDEQDGKINILETEDSYDIPLILDTDTVQAQFSWNPADYFVYDLTTNMSPDNRLLVDKLKTNEIAEQEIKVQASTLYGCIEKDSATVVIVPNVEPLDAFTPNGDGYNDKWLIRYAEQYPELEVAVFNRWGVEIFRRKPYTNENGWNGKNSNGKDLPSGTYYYLIDTHETGVSALTGTVTIVR